MDTLGSQTQSLGTDAILQFTGTGVQIFSGIIFYIIISRLFSSTGVGAISLFVAIVGLFSVVFSFGLGTTVRHFTSYDIGRGDYTSVKLTVYKIIVLGLILSMFGLVALYLLSPIISIIFLHSRSYTFLVKLLSVVLFGNIMFGILNGSMLGIQNFRISAIVNVVIWSIYYLGTIFFAIYLRSLDTIVIGWTVGILLGSLVYFIIIVFSLEKIEDNGSAPPNNNLFKYSAPVLFSGLISFGAAYADRFIVSGLINLSALGVYTYALLIATSINFLSTPLNNILMPKLSQMYGKGDNTSVSKYVKIASTLLSSFYVPVAIGIAAIAPLLLEVLGGISYMGASTALRIMVVISALFISRSILIQAVMSVRLTSIFIKSSSFAFLANVAISYLLIPYIGLTGAAFGFSSVYITTFLILYIYSKNEGLVAFNLTGTAKIWLSAGIMFAGIMLMQYIIGVSIHFLPFYIVFGSFVYTVCTYLLRVFDSNEKEILKSLLPRRNNKLSRLIYVVLLR